MVLNRNFHSKDNVLGRFYKHFLTSLTFYRSTLFDIFFETRLETKIFANWTKATLVKRFIFAICQFKDLFCNIKVNAWKKVNVKYMISRLWHEMFHIIVPGISPRPISALQLCCRAWYRSLGMIPGPIWKMSCNNLLILLMVNNHLLQMCSYL